MVPDVMTRAWHLRQWWSLGRMMRHPWMSARFVFLGREITNFTYPIKNADELAAFLGNALGAPSPIVAGYIAELEADDEFRQWLETGLARRNDRNRRAHYGRRLGWYALVRHVKPKIVFETGTHDGLGSAVMLRALQRNSKEGSVGRLHTFDIDPAAGWLIPEPLHPWFRREPGDIKERLPAVLKLLGKEHIDVFLHDSDHSYGHEAWEFLTVAPYMAKTGIVMSDNAHAEPALEDFCKAAGRAYHFWHEQPKRHPYPGAGIGLGGPPLRKSG